MAYIYVAWFLLALHVLALMGMLLQAREHHGFEGMLSNIPSRHLSATIIGLMIGSNFLTIPALLLGLVAWAFRRNRAGKPIVAVALILIVITTVVAFLLDTAAPR
jgi:phosphotransferase system  glucose/maltose/N-acetylglucosamine-specific IIC component